MALPDSSLSQVCRKIREVLWEALKSTDDDSIKVMLGNPAAADRSTEHTVNLFFYRLEPGGFASGNVPEEPWQLRLHCLITAFAKPEVGGNSDGGASAGENDLRLLGEVVRFFHEKPVLDPIQVKKPAANGNVPEEEEVRVQILFQPLGVDDINHLWSTQGDVAYRPSVAYEMALVPIFPGTTVPAAPRVGELGLEVRGSTGLDARRAAFDGSLRTPPVAATVVDTGREDWAPRVCFVHDLRCAEVLSLPVPDPGGGPIELEIWIAGEGTVRLAWEIWSRARGWQPQAPSDPVAVSGPGLDPEDPVILEPAKTATVTLPIDSAGQALLYAARTYRRASDEIEIEVRSNPLLVSLFEGEDES